MSPEFLLTAFVVVVMPGTGVLYTVSNGLFRGGRAGVAAACGCTLGIVPHLLASVLGLAALLHASAVAFATLKYAGVLYLLYLAWGMWRETGSFAVGTPQSAARLRSIATKGILVNILNPKLSIFFLAFLPQFVDAAAPTALRDMLLLSGVFMVMTLAVFIVYGLCAHAFSASVARAPRRVLWARRSFAGLFALLGIRLAFAER